MRQTHATIPLIGLFTLVAAGCNQDRPENTSAGEVSSLSASGTGDTGADGTADGTSGTADGTGTDGSGETTASGTVDDTGDATADGSTSGAPTSTSSDPDSSTGSGDDTTGGEDKVPCDVASAQLQPVPPRIMLVLDKSGSMISNTWDHDDDPMTDAVTRWYSLHSVVKFIVETFEDQIHFGANLFPSMSATNNFNAGACVVANAPEVPVAPQNAAAILGGIPGANATTIRGGTPAAAGVAVARDHLLGLQGDNPRAMIFIADGAANCSADTIAACTTSVCLDVFSVYDEDLHTFVAETWTQHEIPTYVVGIAIKDELTPDNSQNGEPNLINPHEKMNALAVEGGRPKAGATSFYDTNNELELEAAMDEIIASTLSCTISLNPVPAFPELLELEIDGMKVPRVTDCATEDGWVYSNPHDEIELCGSYCNQLKTIGKVDVEYYCSPG